MRNAANTMLIFLFYYFMNNLSRLSVIWVFMCHYFLELKT